MGNDISLSSEGFQVGRICVSGLLFADDLLVMARSSAGLQRLLKLVKHHADLLKMVINTDKDKSEVISPDGEPGDLWNVVDSHGDVVLSMKQVIEYKYLGSVTFGTIYKTTLEKQKNCVRKAHKYKGTCFFMSRDGPDVVDMLLATWSNVAVPSILHGTEMISFTEVNILELERTQNQIAKYALGLPIGTAGLCAQTELGLKPFRQLLYEHQLKFYIRILSMNESRWVKQALLDHLGVAWASPYVRYLVGIRKYLGLYELPMSVPRLLRFMDDFFVCETNRRLSKLKLPWIQPLVKFRRQLYAQEGEASTTLAKFRYDIAGIGNKYPRLGMVTTRSFCLLCIVQTNNSVSHLAMFCPALELIRKERTSISLFRNLCVSQGFSTCKAYSLFINGKDLNEHQQVVGAQDVAG